MTREAIQYLALDRISILPQVRKHFDQESLHGLAVSLREVGQLQPIRVRREGDRLVVVDGERRFRAAKIAGFDSIAAILEERQLSPPEVTQRQLIADCHCKNLKPIDLASAIRDLMEGTGWTASEAAGHLGFSKATVTRLLSLLSLPEAVRDQVATGALAASTAYEISKVADAAKQVEMAREAANGKLTRDAVNGRAKHKRNAKARAAKKPVPKVVAKLSDGRSVAFSGPELSSVAVLIAWLEELLAAAKSLPEGADLVAFAETVEQTKEYATR
jgi:ParB family chromosome partitioning protein